MSPRALPLALLLAAATAACAEPRTPGDCVNEPDCLAGYREAVIRLRVCISDRQPSPGPGRPPPPNCDKARAEVDRWADVVSRERGKKQQEPAGEPAKSFEVPPLPPSGSPPAP